MSQYADAEICTDLPQTTAEFYSVVRRVVTALTVGWRHGSLDFVAFGILWRLSKNPVLFPDGTIVLSN